MGQNEKTAVGVLASAAISLASWHRETSPARFIHLDFTTGETPWADLALRLREVTPDCAAAGRRRELPALLGGVYDEVVARLADPETTHREEIYLFVWGLQRARDLREDEGGAHSRGWDDTDAAPILSSAQQFARILRASDQNLGVHVIAWCDSYGNLTKTLPRQEIGEFDLRIVFQMNAEDSSYLIDSPAASKLGPNRAYLLDEYTGATEKFRPYDVPEEQWLRHITRR